MNRMILALVMSTLIYVNTAIAQDKVVVIPWPGSSSASVTGVDWSEIANRPAGLDDGDDNTQLSESQVDLYVSNNGYLITEADGSTTNEIELPAQTGNSGKFLTTNGSSPSWSDVSYSSLTGAPTNISTFTNDSGYLTSEVDGDATNELELPSQTGNSGKYLTTNGSSVSWAPVSGSSSGQIIAGGSVINGFGTGTNYVPIGAGRTNDYDGSKSRMPLSGTITDMEGSITAVTAAGTYTFTLVKNDTDQSLTCNFDASSNLNCTDSSNCVDVAVGNYIVMKIVGAGADNRPFRWSAVFTPGASCP